jgi:hypothetical protein
LGTKKVVQKHTACVPFMKQLWLPPVHTVPVRHMSTSVQAELGHEVGAMAYSEGAVSARTPPEMARPLTSTGVE